MYIIIKKLAKKMRLIALYSTAQETRQHSNTSTSSLYKNISAKQDIYNHQLCLFVIDVHVVTGKVKKLFVYDTEVWGCCIKETQIWKRQTHYYHFRKQPLVQSNTKSNMFCICMNESSKSSNFPLQVISITFISFFLFHVKALNKHFKPQYYTYTYTLYFHSSFSTLSNQQSKKKKSIKSKGQETSSF